MGSEDFGEFGQAGVPVVQLYVGAAEPSAFAKAKAAGTTLPGPHSSLFAPDREPTIRTGTATLTLAALELLAKH
jgi:hippurate hydrolase